MTFRLGSSQRGHNWRPCPRSHKSAASNHTVWVTGDVYLPLGPSLVEYNFLLPWLNHFFNHLKCTSLSPTIRRGPPPDKNRCFEVGRGKLPAVSKWGQKHVASSRIYTFAFVFRGGPHSWECWVAQGHWWLHPDGMKTKRRTLKIIIWERQCRVREIIRWK